MQDPEFGEVGWVDGAPAVVGFALVALGVVLEGVLGEGGGGSRTGRLSYQYAFIFAVQDVCRVGTRGAKSGGL